MNSVVRRNRNVFVSLLASETPHLLPHLEDITLAPNQRLQRAGERIDHIYLPHNSVIALVASGTPSVEFAMLGHEGILGGAAGFGVSDAICDATVRIGGSASRLTPDRLQTALSESEVLRRAVTAGEATLAMKAQHAAVCNTLHPVEARLCHLLLELSDRLESDELPVTQAALADALGVQRTTVTLVIGKLQSSGALACGRGRIRVADSAALVQNTCSCHDHGRRLAAKLVPARREPVVSPVVGADGAGVALV
jgi:CRP-like cAMP-binding protein